MKKFYLLAILSFLCQALFACSFLTKSFCSTTSMLADHVIIKGEVIASDSLGIDVQVLKVWRGVESRDVIRIWNGTNWDCNGFFIFMEAYRLGEVGDILVVALPKIGEQENTWDIIGDYRRPDHLGSTPHLEIEDNTVSGFIRGEDGYINNESMNLTTLEDSFLDYGDCYAITVSSKEVVQSTNVVVNNPSSSHLNIQFPEEAFTGMIRLYGINGLEVKALNISLETELEIDVMPLPKGIYVLQIIADKQKPFVMKIIKS